MTILSRNHHLMKSFDHLLGSLLLASQDAATKYRARAIRSVGLILDRDPKLLGSNVAIQKAVKSRLRDVARSVRQAALDLVGGFVVAEYAIETALCFLLILVLRMRFISSRTS